jgi:hypothetical protein
MLFGKLYSPEGDEGGGDDPKKGYAPKKVDPPKDYKPLGVVERKNWNDFLDYLQAQGIGGSAALDKRDQTLGLSYLTKYNKENPDKAIDPSIIPHIQYEQYMLRKGDSFPGLKPEELKYIRQGLTRADGTSPYLSKDVSDPDSWLGSLTSREYYPTSHRGTNQGDSYDFGVNFEDYVRSLGDPSIAEKYKVKTK